MAKQFHSNNVELQALRSEIAAMNKRMEEVIIILSGNSTYGVAGVLKDFKELKSDVHSINGEIGDIKDEIEKMKRAEIDAWSIPLKTIPQKIAAIVAFITMLISIVQGVRSLFIVAQ